MKLLLIVYSTSVLSPSANVVTRVDEPVTLVICLEYPEIKGFGCERVSRCRGYCDSHSGRVAIFEISQTVGYLGHPAPTNEFKRLSESSANSVDKFWLVMRPITVPE